MLSDKSRRVESTKVEIGNFPHPEPQCKRMARRAKNHHPAQGAHRAPIIKKSKYSGGVVAACTAWASAADDTTGTFSPISQRRNGTAQYDLAPDFSRRNSATPA